ncbi:MAG: hypothetical protein KDG89_10995 [Geminicoccaceae bacterium]|nr:hypothetical protein [Geminicoccaceae bacterium]
MPSLLRRLAGAFAFVAILRSAWHRRAEGEAAPDPRHEPDRVRAGVVLATIGGLALFIGLTFFGVTWLFGTFVSDRHALQESIHPMASGDAVPPRPRLQTDPTAELAGVRTRSARLLGGEGEGMPIEAAMAAIAARGAAAYAPLLPPEPPPRNRRAPANVGGRP